MVFLAVAAFLLTSGEVPAWAYVLSSVGVLFFALPSFWAVKMWLGWADGSKLIAILGIYALAVVSAAVFSGFPYGQFGYSEKLGYKIFGEVPWTIAFAWTPLVLCSWAAARSFFESRTARVLCSTALLVAFDLVIDPAAVLLGFWSYPSGVYYGVPLSNYLGWFGGGLLASILVEAAVSYLRPQLPPPVQIGSSAFFILFFWTSVAAFGGLGIPAAAGGAGALAMYLWYRHSYYAFDEMVVLVDDDNNVLGTAPKGEIHNSDTALHRAFSVFLFNSNGELLLQRRAFSKKTWPGTWSNSCCGHTMLNERTEQAAARRLAHELGLRGVTLQMALPDYRYRAEKDGIVENEICPVLIGMTDDAPVPNPSEVAEFEWVPWHAFLDSIRRPDCELSPWAIEEGLLLATSPLLRKLLGPSWQRKAA
jgi:isopentenyl-diphosphate Delta-isomerase